MNKKISELEEAIQVHDEDVIPIVQNNQNKKIKYENLVGKKYIIEIEEDIASETEYELPCNYSVGANRLELLLEGIELIKDKNFEEVGETGAVSNKVKLCEIKAGCILVIKIRGEVEENV